MGANSSSGGGSDEQKSVPTQRRRLSVGTVGAAATEADNAGDEEDRGLIAKLNEASIIEMCGEQKGRRMSIGSATDQVKTSFANKTIKQMGDDLDPAKHGMGFTCRKGLKPEAPNQDSWTILKTEARSIYAVFDGHGQKGHDVSNFVKDNLLKLIIKDPRLKTNDYAELSIMLREAFRKSQDLVATADRMHQLSAQMSGTTATLCVHDHLHEDYGKITVAHVGDSSAVLGTRKGSEYKAESLTEDHKPNRADERARIEEAGGRVVFDGYANHRVYAKAGRYPGLNMSRCIGDLIGHKACGLTAEPEVCEKALTAEDTFLLLCTDGVWEFTSPIEAVQLVAEFEAARTPMAADRLAREAWDRWIKEEGGMVVDDITVVLINLPASRETIDRRAAANSTASALGQEEGLDSGDEEGDESRAMQSASSTMA